jgi:hypothetical protein
MFRRKDVVFAVASVVLFAIAVMAGHGMKSLAFLGAGIWWIVSSRYWASKARAARRHRELHYKRLERERKGLAPPRG